MTFHDHVRRALADLAGAQLLREPRLVSSPQGPTVIVDGREVVLLCSNDYLGLAGDETLAAALAAGARSWGPGAAASRLISGTMAPHRAAEVACADYVGAPRALLFGSGYAANVGAIQALVGPEDLVLSDELNHASLIDGCRLSRATVRVYRHADPDHLSSLLATHRHAHRAALVVSDSLFSMDGDVAPVAALRAICDRWDAGLLIDEAHALGVLGPGGRGASAAAGIRPDVLVGTLGKAFGLAGAFVAGTDPVVRLIENRARSFVFSTAMPPALAAAIPVALDRVAAADDRRTRLLAHAARLRAALEDLRLTLVPGSSPILPVLLGDPARAMRASLQLLERGVFVHGIRPPTVPPGTARLRVVPIATHSLEHLDRAIDAFSSLASELR